MHELLEAATWRPLPFQPDVHGQPQGPLARRDDKQGVIFDPRHRSRAVLVLPYPIENRLNALLQTLPAP